LGGSVLLQQKDGSQRCRLVNKIGGAGLNAYFFPAPTHRRPQRFIGAQTCGGIQAELVMGETRSHNGRPRGRRVDYRHIIGQHGMPFSHQRRQQGRFAGSRQPGEGDGLAL
jgi:hypothetical protein